MRYGVLLPELTRAQRWSASGGVLAALGGVWALLTYGGFVRPYFLTPPHVVFATLVTRLGEGSFRGDAYISVFRIVSGFLASAAAAVPLGILAARYPRVDAALMPTVSFVRYLPVPALLPFSILWFGIGEVQKIAIVFIGVFFQLVVMIADRARSVPDSLVESASLLGLKRRQTVTHVVVPFCLPGILDDLRVTMGWAWGWLILAELVGASRGLGFGIIRAQRFLNNADMMAALLLIGLLGLTFDLALALISRLWFRWR